MFPAYRREGLRTKIGERIGEMGETPYGNAIGSVTQKVEYSPLKRKVASSILARPTKFNECPHGEMDITRDFGSRFAGSSPAGGTKSNAQRCADGHRIVVM